MTYSGQYTLIYSFECMNYKMVTQFKCLTLICRFLSKSRWKLWNAAASLYILTQINGITVWYPISSLLGLTCDHGESPMLLHQWKTLNPIMDHFSGTYQCPFHNRFHEKTQIENKLCVKNVAYIWIKLLFFRLERDRIQECGLSIRQLLLIRTMWRFCPMFNAPIQLLERNHFGVFNT